MDQEKELKKSIKQAEILTKNPRAIEALADRAQAKANKNPKIFKNIRKDVALLIRLARAWASGKYKDIGIGSILIAVGAILYLLDPIDVIPDFIPILGLTDDATVLALAISRLRKELDKFEDWESEVTLS